jgi:SH3-like domain-containing protein
MKYTVLLAFLGASFLASFTAAPSSAQEEATGQSSTPQELVKDPTKGNVTNLDIPRYVTLKGGEGNARRGPGLTHKIDWVFTRSGMPLKVTAEHENWRKVEDSEGMGGWVHYSLLSGSRSILVTRELAEFYDFPDPTGQVLFQAESGVVGRLLECQLNWCRVNIQGEKGWVPKTSLWGVEPQELVE